MSTKVISHILPPRKVGYIRNLIAERDQIVRGLRQIRETVSRKDRNALDKAIGFIESYDAINNIVGELEGVTVDRYLCDTEKHGVMWEETIFIPLTPEEAVRERTERIEQAKRQQERIKAYMMQFVKNTAE